MNIGKVELKWNGEQKLVNMKTVRKTAKHKHKYVPLVKYV